MAEGTTAAAESELIPERAGATQFEVNCISFRLLDDHVSMSNCLITNKTAEIGTPPEQRSYLLGLILNVPSQYRPGEISRSC